MNAPVVAFDRTSKGNTTAPLFSRVMTVLMTLPGETLAKIIARCESEVLHSPEQKELRTRRLKALKKVL